MLEIDLTQELPANELGQSLNEQMPDGIEILGTERLEPPAKARVESVGYRATGDLPVSAVERCTAATELRTTRSNGRTVDIRPYVKSLNRCDGGCEFEVLVTQAGSAKPSEIAAALCDDDISLVRRLCLTRTAVNLQVS